ncbi:hypothetical protein ACFXO9_26785 [Nocardia tengchongensis]|uniref:hypothetical protein n=1 Tax=Nocardia tengchongensis TaxID=2055889 RepID=UPI0036C259AA
MTEPNPPTSMTGQPAWRLRLLDRIQNLAADRARVLQHGYQIPAATIGGTPVLAWRTQLHLLADARDEVEAHARGLGIAQVHIDDARLLGNQGFHVHSDAGPGNPVREKMIDGVVNDTWQLQHMAAIHVVAALRPNTVGAGADSEMAAQLERNMAALWMRATAVSHAVTLTAEEYAGMWATDAPGWQRVLSATVDAYDSPGLEERWRIYAWPGLADEAHRDLRALGINPADTFAPEPIPLPHTMYEQVSSALDHTVDTAVAHTIDHAIDTALPTGHELNWSTQPPEIPDSAPPVAGPSPGAEP